MVRTVATPVCYAFPILLAVPRSSSSGLSQHAIRCQLAASRRRVSAALMLGAAAESEDCGCDDSTPGSDLASTGNVPPPRVLIQYCTGCRWMMRAAWVAQELLTTFEKEFKGGQVAISPADPDALGNGVFTVSLNDEEIFSRKKAGRFPELKELKGLVRDRIVPGRSLGHSEPGGMKGTSSPNEAVQVKT